MCGVEIWFYDSDGRWKNIYCTPLRGAVDFEKIRIYGRLHQNAKKGAFNWSANFPVPSGAQYEPSVKLEFREGKLVFLGRYQHSLGHYEISKITDAFALSWGGRECITPALITAKEVRDLSYRKERMKVVETAERSTTEGKMHQGNLEIKKVKGSIRELFEAVEISDEIREKIVRTRWFAKIFNHGIHGSYFEILRLDNKAVIEVHDEAIITSPQHITQPIILTAGVWLLSHPWPEPEDNY